MRDPRIAEVGVLDPATSADGWFASPDSRSIDAEGQRWVLTDQGTAWARTQHADGLYAVEADGLRSFKLFYCVREAL